MKSSFKPVFILFLFILGTAIAGCSGGGGGGSVSSSYVSSGNTPSPNPTQTNTASSPSITSMNPSAVTLGASGTIQNNVTIYGKNFGTGTGSVTIDIQAKEMDEPKAAASCSVVSWKNTQITAKLPANTAAGTYNLYVTSSTGVKSAAVIMTVAASDSPLPMITSVEPSDGINANAGLPQITLNGSNFGTSNGNVFLGVDSTPTAALNGAVWSNTKIIIPSQVTQSMLNKSRAYFQVKNASGVSSNTVSLGITTTSTPVDDGDTKVYAMFTANKGGNLLASDNDATELRNALASGTANSVWNGADSTLLLTPSATKASTISKINEIAGKADGNDIFLFYYSGHGSGGSFNTISPSELSAALSRINSGTRKIVILDCCDSGMAIAGLQNVSNITILASTKTSGVEDAQEGRISTNYFSMDAHSMTHYSHDHGYLTYFLLRGFGDNGNTMGEAASGSKVMLSGIIDYASIQTKNYATYLGLSQNPSTFTNSDDFMIKGK